MNGGTESDDFILLQDDQLCAELYPEVYGNSDRELEQEPKLYSPWSSADEEFEDMDRRVIEVSEEEEVEVERRVVEYESECEPAVQFAECSTNVQERRILEYTTAGVIVDLLCGFCVEGDELPHLNNLNGVSGTHLAKSWEEFLSLSEMKRKVGIHEINLFLENNPRICLQWIRTQQPGVPGHLVFKFGKLRFFKKVLRQARVVYPELDPDSGFF